MKSHTALRTRSNWLHAFIQDATDAPANDLAQIENIMRDEIFHSTLDWQSREQLAKAARQAFVHLDENREMYALDHACRVAMFQEMRAQSALRERDTPAHRAAVANAELCYQVAQGELLVRLDEVLPTD